MSAGIGTSGLSEMVDRSKKYELLQGELAEVRYIQSSKRQEHIGLSVNRSPAPVDGSLWCVNAICTSAKKGKLKISVRVKKPYGLRHLWAIYTGLQRLNVPEKQAKAAVARFWKDCDDLNGDE